MDPCLIPDDITLVEPARTLDRGFLGLGGRLDVPEGAVAVITVGGRYYETLSPGSRDLSGYEWGRNVQAYFVQTRERQLRFTSNGQFYIQVTGADGSRAPVKINVELLVGYQVLPQNAQRVALEIDKPAAKLCGFVMDAVRESVKWLDIEAFLTGGRALAERVRSELEKARIEQKTGLTLGEVVALSLTGADRVSETMVQQVLQSHEGIDADWLIRNRPELYSQLLKMAMEHSAPAAILNQPLNTDANPLLNLLLPGTGSQPPRKLLSDAQSSGDVGRQAEQASPQPVHTDPISPGCIEREWAALEKVAQRVDGRPGLKGPRAIPDGSFDFVLIIQAASRQDVQIDLHLPVGFEQGAAPRRQVTIKGENQKFPPVTEADWQADPRLTRLVEDVRRYYA
jgi:hypothetical protein